MIMGEMDSLICYSHPDCNPETGAAHACGHSIQVATAMGAFITLTESGVLAALSLNSGRTNAKVRWQRTSNMYRRSGTCQIVYLVHIRPKRINYIVFYQFKARMPDQVTYILFTPREKVV